MRKESINYQLLTIIYSEGVSFTTIEIVDN